MTVAARPLGAASRARSQALLVAALLALAGLAWWQAERQMGPMSSAPGGDLGSVGFYTGLWVVMMAAMMFPSIAPMVFMYDRLRAGRRARGAPAPGFEGSALFVAGYLVAWTVAGLLAYLLLEGGRALDLGFLAWDRAGREVTGAVLLVSAGYQLTPLKDVCLTRCRGPFMFLIERWRDGRMGALRLGLSHGGWCVGCCWALMATLFAVGLMSLGWMAFIAALIAGEKLLPPRFGASRAIAVVLLVLGVAVLLAPDAVPGVGDMQQTEMAM